MQIRTIIKHFRSEEVHRRVRHSVVYLLTCVPCKMKAQAQQKVVHFIGNTPRQYYSLGFPCVPQCYHADLSSEVIFPEKNLQNHLQTDIGRVRNTCIIMNLEVTLTLLVFSGCLQHSNTEQRTNAET